MKTITTAELDAHQLALIEEVASTREEIVVTRDGKPVAKVVPIEQPRRRRTLEELGREITIVGDIESPVDEWDVMK